jgi:hypothetical protein
VQAGQEGAHGRLHAGGRLQLVQQHSHAWGTGRERGERFRGGREKGA